MSGVPCGRPSLSPGGTGGERWNGPFRCHRCGREDVWPFLSRSPSSASVKCSELLVTTAAGRCSRWPHFPADEGSVPPSPLGRFVRPHFLLWSMTASVGSSMLPLVWHCWSKRSRITHPNPPTILNPEVSSGQAERILAGCKNTGIPPPPTRH